MKDKEIKLVGGFGKKCNKDTQWHYQNRVYDSEHIATSLTSVFQPNYLTHTHTQESKMELRIRKLVPLETLKLMGFERKDEQAMREIGMTDSAIYHCAGDALVTTLAALLFATMLPMGEDAAREKVEKYIDSLVEK